LIRKNKNVVGYIISFGITVLILEGISAIFIRTGKIQGHIPTYRILEDTFTRLWVDMDPNFGVWHPSDFQFRHKSACFDIIRKTNSYGAADKERTRNSDQYRIVLLGDSFLEGYGVSDEDRFSNLLEEWSGTEFLNFGTSGNFGPTQYWQLYEHLAEAFDHEELWVMILPDNDFLDDYPRPGRYHPYLEGEYPDYKLKYTLDNIMDSKVAPDRKSPGMYLKEFSYFASVAYHLKRFLTGKDNPEEVVKSKNNNYSGYYDYREAELLRLRFVLERLKESSEGKVMRVFTLPRLNDLVRFQYDDTPPLPLKLAEIAAEVKFQYYDLLPEMNSRYYQKWEELVLSCDGHWSAEGHRLAAEIMMERTGIEKSE
jgi:hypothetical protein